MNSIDNNIEKVASKEKLTQYQVKNIIKMLVSDKEMWHMMMNRVFGLNPTDPDYKPLDIEPKLTRSKAKELFEQQRKSCEENYSPNTSQTISDTWKAAQDVLDEPDTHALVAVEFPDYEEENDEEYHPEPGMSDEESMLSASFASPSTIHSLKFRNSTPNNNKSNLSTPCSGKRAKTPSSIMSTKMCNIALAQRKLSFNSTAVPVPVSEDVLQPTSLISTRTRSKFPIDTPLEDLELAFNPPDITPDMYGTVEDDDEWKQFLLDFVQPEERMATPEDEDCTQDPEYILNPGDGLTFNDIKEEFRLDKVAKISKREVNLLLNDYLEPDGLQTPNKTFINKKVIHNQAFMHSCASELADQFSMLPPTTWNLPFTTWNEEYETNNVQINDSPTSSPVWHSEEESYQTESVEKPISHLVYGRFEIEQWRVIGCQLRQHVQLLLQTYLNSFIIDRFAKEQLDCKNYLHELDSRRRPGCAIYDIMNLDAALQTVRGFENIRTELMDMESYNQQQKHPSRHLYGKLLPEYPLPLAKLILNSRAFLYLEHLTTGLFHDKAEKPRRVILDSEYPLLAATFQEVISDVELFEIVKRSRTRKKNPEFLEALQIVSRLVGERYAMHCHPEMLNRHLKRLLKYPEDDSRVKDNPVMKFAREGTYSLPRVEAKIITVEDLKPLKFKKGLPAIYRKLRKDIAQDERAKATNVMRVENASYEDEKGFKITVTPLDKTTTVGTLLMSAQPSNKCQSCSQTGNEGAFRASSATASKNISNPGPAEKINNLDSGQSSILVHKAKSVSRPVNTVAPISVTNTISTAQSSLSNVHINNSNFHSGMSSNADNRNSANGQIQNANNTDLQSALNIDSMASTEKTCVSCSDKNFQTYLTVVVNPPNKISAPRRPRAKEEVIGRAKVYRPTQNDDEFNGILDLLNNSDCGERLKEILRDKASSKKGKTAKSINKTVNKRKTPVKSNNKTNNKRETPVKNNYINFQSNNGLTDLSADNSNDSQRSNILTELLLNALTHESPKKYNSESLKPLVAKDETIADNTKTTLIKAKSSRKEGKTKTGEKLEVPKGETKKRDKTTLKEVEATKTPTKAKRRVKTSPSPISRIRDVYMESNSTQPFVHSMPLLTSGTPIKNFSSPFKVLNLKPSEEHENIIDSLSLSKGEESKKLRQITDLLNDSNSYSPTRRKKTRCRNPVISKFSKSHNGKGVKNLNSRIVDKDTQNENAQNNRKGKVKSSSITNQSNFVASNNYDSNKSNSEDCIADYKSGKERLKKNTATYKSDKFESSKTLNSSDKDDEILSDCASETFVGNENCLQGTREENISSSVNNDQNFPGNDYYFDKSDFHNSDTNESYSENNGLNNSKNLKIIDNDLDFIENNNFDNCDNKENHSNSNNNHLNNSKNFKKEGSKKRKRTPTRLKDLKKSKLNKSEQREAFQYENEESALVNNSYEVPLSSKNKFLSLNVQSSKNSAMLSMPDNPISNNFDENPEIGDVSKFCGSNESCLKKLSKPMKFREAVPEIGDLSKSTSRTSSNKFEGVENSSKSNSKKLSKRKASKPMKFRINKLSSHSDNLPSSPISFPSLPQKEAQSENKSRRKCSKPKKRNVEFESSIINKFKERNKDDLKESNQKVFKNRKRNNGMKEKEEKVCDESDGISYKNRKNENIENREHFRANVRSNEQNSNTSKESLSNKNEESLSNKNEKSLSNKNEESLSNKNKESLSNKNKESLSNKNKESLSNKNNGEAEKVKNKTFNLKLSEQIESFENSKRLFQMEIIKDFKRRLIERKKANKFKDFVALFSKFKKCGDSNDEEMMETFFEMEKFIEENKMGEKFARDLCIFLTSQQAKILKRSKLFRAMQRRLWKFEFL